MTQTKAVHLEYDLGLIVTKIKIKRTSKTMNRLLLKQQNFRLFSSSMLALACIVALSGCATLAPESDTLGIELQQLRESVDQLEKSLDEQYTEICTTQNKASKQAISKLETELKKSRKEFSDLQKKCAVTGLSDKLLLGEVERVELIDEKITLSARIDTGAETSSLGVYKLQEFERDGRQWVKFKLENKKSSATYEYRVRGRVSIKQGADSDGESRLEIRVNLRLGNKDYPRQVFNLADRSYLEHQVLIGRSFLTDVAVVDTSARYLLKKR